MLDPKRRVGEAGEGLEWLFWPWTWIILGLIAYGIFLARRLASEP